MKMTPPYFAISPASPYERKYLVDQRYPHAIKIRLAQDNLNTHVKASLYKAFLPSEARRILDKIEFYYTPKHGS